MKTPATVCSRASRANLERDRRCGYPNRHTPRLCYDSSTRAAFRHAPSPFRDQHYALLQAGHAFLDGRQV